MHLYLLCVIFVAFVFVEAAEEYILANGYEGELVLLDTSTMSNIAVRYESYTRGAQIETMHGRIYAIDTRFGSIFSASIQEIFNSTAKRNIPYRKKHSWIWEAHFKSKQFDINENHYMRGNLGKYDSLIFFVTNLGHAMAFDSDTRKIKFLFDLYSREERYVSIVVYLDFAYFHFSDKLVSYDIRNEKIQSIEIVVKKEATLILLENGSNLCLAGGIDTQSDRLTKSVTCCTNKEKLYKDLNEAKSNAISVYINSLKSSILLNGNLDGGCMSNSIEKYDRFHKMWIHLPIKLAMDSPNAISIAI